MSNDEAVQFVCEYLHDQMILYMKYSVTQHREPGTSTTSDSSSNTGAPLLSSQFLPSDAMHNAARELALEAYVRGSGDNIGVCIVEIE